MSTAVAPPPPPDFRPQVFGKFFLLQRLAVGGMAEIFRAKVVGAGGFEKELVLKRILPARSQDAQFIRMLVNEAKLTVQLTHGNVAQIYECGAVGGTYFIAMELVHGVSLKEMLGTFPQVGATLSPEQATYLVVQLLQGLSYAHRKVDAEGRPLQIVHCDVSPENALVTWEGEVKLLDFGIARAATGLSNYKEGMLMGKLGYVAPEQASIERAWDHRVDVFAAGVLLYELLTWKKPFPKASDPEELLASRRAPVPPPSSVDPRVPTDLDAIVKRALAVDPDQRFPDARAFAEALVDVLFPTPHSAIQESLALKMRQVFAERIGRERAARAHDALVMKVLENTQREPAPAAAPATPPAPDPLADLTDASEPARSPRTAPSRPKRRALPAPFPLGRALLVLLLGAAAGAGGAWALARQVAEGAVLVTSDPPGATVTVDGAPASGPTPVLVEGLRLGESHAITLAAPDRRTTTVELAPERRAYRKVHAQLELALVSVRLESVPAGAEVRLDGKTIGTTPLTIPALRADERRRVDLALAGHELDQFVLMPERDGTHVSRTLAKIAPPPPATPRQAKAVRAAGR